MYQPRINFDKNGLGSFWPTFSKTHLVTLSANSAIRFRQIVPEIIFLIGVNFDNFCQVVIRGGSGLIFLARI
jgi:hypothetical protein